MNLHAKIVCEYTILSRFLLDTYLSYPECQMRTMSDENRQKIFFHLWCLEHADKIMHRSKIYSVLIQWVLIRHSTVRQIHTCMEIVGESAGTSGRILTFVVNKVDAHLQMIAEQMGNEVGTY